MREICDRYDVLMISDEVICAWGRLGHYFGCERFGYVPDIITVAKALTSAYAPMGAMIASDRVAEPFMQGDASFAHGFTFAGHPLASAIAMANLDVFEREDLCGHVLAKEGEFRADAGEPATSCRSSATCAAPATSTRSSWSKTRRPRRASDDEESEELLRGFLSGELYRRGLICRADDRGDPVVQLAPPLIADTEQFEEIHDVLHGVLDEAWKRVVEVGLRDAHGPEPARRARPRSLSPGSEAAAAPVRWVHISELEDPTPWLSGGELMLTTGIPLDSAAKQRAFVRLLADRNLAGLGFGTGFSHRKLPKALVDEARKRDFPLFEVPYSTPFIAITEKAFARLVNEQYEVLQRGIAVQRRLERLVLEERGLEEIVGDDLLGGRGHASRSSTAAASGWPGAAFVASSPTEALGAIRKEALSHAGDGHPFVPAHPAVAGRALAHPVISPGGGPPQAWVVIVRDSGGLGDFERLILQQAVAVVALELMRRRVARETERRLAGDVLAGALGGRMEPSELRRRLEPFGIGEEAAVLVFALDDPTAAEPALERALAAEACPAVVAPHSSGGARAALRGRRRRRSRPDRGRRRGPQGASLRARRGARRRQPPGSAGAAAALLPRGSLRAGGDRVCQRRGARGRLLARPRRLHPAALDPRR